MPTKATNIWSANVEVAFVKHIESTNEMHEGITNSIKNSDKISNMSNRVFSPFRCKTAMLMEDLLVMIMVWRIKLTSKTNDKNTKKEKFTTLVIQC